MRLVAGIQLWWPPPYCWWNEANLLFKLTKQQLVLNDSCGWCLGGTWCNLMTKVVWNKQDGYETSITTRMIVKMQWNSLQWRYRYSKVKKSMTNRDVALQREDQKQSMATEFMSRRSDDRRTQTNLPTEKWYHSSPNPPLISIFCTSPLYGYIIETWYH